VRSYILAALGHKTLSRVKCNAPLRSYVVEPDLGLRACYFSPIAGNLEHQPINELRKHLCDRTSVTNEKQWFPQCAACVCPRMYEAPKPGVSQVQHI